MTPLNRITVLFQHYQHCDTVKRKIAAFININYLPKKVVSSLVTVIQQVIGSTEVGGTLMLVTYLNWESLPDVTTFDGTPAEIRQLSVICYNSDVHTAQ